MPWPSRNPVKRIFKSLSYHASVWHRPRPKQTATNRTKTHWSALVPFWPSRMRVQNKRRVQLSDTWYVDRNISKRWRAKGKAFVTGASPIHRLQLHHVKYSKGFTPRIPTATLTVGKTTRIQTHAWAGTSRTDIITFPRDGLGPSEYAYCQ